MTLKSVLLLTAFLLSHNLFFAQAPFPYDRSWKKIDSLMKQKDLPKSALEEINKVHAAAKKEKREEQWVRAVIYLQQLRGRSDEDIVETRGQLEQEILAAPPRVAAILRSLEADLFFSYLQQQRYNLSKRTEIVSDSSQDISTWTAGRLNKKIRELYLASLKDENLLQQTSLGAFDAVIRKGNVRYLRPTLYDLLLQRALDYFQHDDPEQAASEDAFLMDDPAVFFPAQRFAGYAFRGSDSSSNHLIALRLFQNLLRFHAGDASPDAGIDADISRLSFAKRYAVLPGKDSLYLSALREITNRFPALPAAAQAWYLQAAYFSERAAAFDPLEDTAHRYDYIYARAVCDLVLKQKDSSEGKSNCYTLRKNICRKAFHLQVEKVNLPDLPFRALVAYKNINHIYLRVIRIDDATRDALSDNGWNPDLWKKLSHYPVLKNDDQALPETHDYQEHRVEIKLEGLPYGQYALFSSSDLSFAGESVLAVQFFFCSSIAFVNHGQDYFVADRSTGEPLPGVKVQALDPVYDAQLQREVFKKNKRYQTDQHGQFRLPRDTENRYRSRLEFYHGKDYLSFTGERLYGYNNGDVYSNTDADSYEKSMRKDVLFTDRALYRPGQTVFYKGLVMTRDFSSRRYKPEDGLQSKIYLTDANDQNLDSVLVQADDFGSFHGSFRLPENLLNGEFHIQDSATGDRRDFSVEEYKRPRFYVSYNPLQADYSIGDSLQITGSAKGYAGQSISGSIVRYRVVRESRFPYPWYFRRMPAGAEQEITQGETETGTDGSFAIHFRALADPATSKESKPVFTFRIAADITDANGETRSATTSFAVSYQSFQIRSSLAQESRMAWDSLQQIPLTTTNASGEFRPQRLTVSVYQLKAPERLIRARYWEQPDQFVMTKADYLSAFPNDEYDAETNKKNWSRELKYQKTDSTHAAGLFDLLPAGKALSGWILLEFSGEDRNGEKITDKRYVELVNSGAKTPGYPTYNAFVSEEQTAEPGSEVRLITGSSVPDVYVIRAKETVDDSLTQYSFYKLDNEIKSSTWKVEEKDRGGFAVNDVFIKNNRWYSCTHLIQVPWTNKELQVSYETWRDKMLPGSAEKWRIRISGNRKNKVTAEVLSAMYDASLDQFKKQGWDLPDIYPVFSERDNWSGTGDFTDGRSLEKPILYAGETIFYKRYDQLFFSVPENRRMLMRNMSFDAALSAPKPGQEYPVLKGEIGKFTPPKILQNEESEKAEPQPNPADIQIRKNFNETAFFLPDLKTDAEGNVDIAFTMPEALTQWKWMIFAHTRDLAFGYAEKAVITQKELMLLPNIPRFFREGDSLQLPVKLSNVSASAMAGTISLDWLDAGIGGHTRFAPAGAQQPFQVNAGQSTVLYFPISIPDNFQQPVVYRLQAKTNTGSASDGEEGIIPVLSNRMAVTETFPLNLAGLDSQSFSWGKLLNSGNSSTLKNQSLIVEYTSNPAWYAIQSLPYLMEFPYECAEQTFNRFYANALASQMVSSAPGIQAVFEKWKQSDTAALLSNLQKNQELKTVLLRETPWVLDAQDENRQKKNLALLFDLVKMNAALKTTLDKLKPMQSADGGFPWFAGGRDDRYITQYIISGIGHLKKLNAVPEKAKSDVDAIVRSALAYLDKQLKSDYDSPPKKGGEAISASQIQYLYMRSFFPENGLPGTVFPALNYYRKLAIRDWTKQNMYLRGMTALFLFRSGDHKTANDIMHSLKENASQSAELGIYWKSVSPGYYWQESPVETQALLIEAFSEISPDQPLIDQMKYWLLQKKQSSRWSNTKSTADACYALLLKGSNWLASGQQVEIRLGDYSIRASEEKTEAGTGYMKKVITGADIVPAMGNMQVTVQSGNNNPSAPSWGAVYWQYFENLDRMTTAQSPLAISKSVYILKNTASGPQMEPLNAGSTIKPGDQLTTRIILKTDRDMDYLHLKDMRAACLEPKNVLSGYHWQAGLGYYETTTDQSTSFFFDHLPGGTHVFEYPVFVSTAGTFSNGISTLECMYAPEFAAHTEGLRITVAGK